MSTPNAGRFIRLTDKPHIVPQGRGQWMCVAMKHTTKKYYLLNVRRVATGYGSNPSEAYAAWTLAKV